MHAVILILPDQFQHNFRNLRIELASFSLLEFPRYNLLGEHTAVASLGGHGIVGIRNPDDSCNLRDFGSRKSVRIAFSVIALMMPPCTDGNVRDLRYLL